MNAYEQLDDQESFLLCNNSSTNLFKSSLLTRVTPFRLRFESAPLDFLPIILSVFDRQIIRWPRALENGLSAVCVYFKQIRLLSIPFSAIL